MMGLKEVSTNVIYFTQFLASFSEIFPNDNSKKWNLVLHRSLA